MIQIFAKQAVLNASLKILVSRGDDAHVDADGRLPAHAVELAFRQDTQEARLQRSRHVADLIEEQSSAVSLLETAAALRVSSSEGAFFMAKELRLQ